MTERGRDVGAVIEQYTSQVKPAFERFIGPSRKHADVIIPWSRRALLWKEPFSAKAAAAKPAFEHTTGRLVHRELIGDILEAMLC